MKKDIEKLRGEIAEIQEELRGINKLSRGEDLIKERHAASSICALSGLGIGAGLNLFGNISYHLYGAACYIASHLADIASTIYIFKENEKFKKKYGYSEAVEENPALPEQPTAKEIISWGLKARKPLACIALSAICPPIGFYLSTKKFLASWNNKMMAKRIRLEDKLREKTKDIIENL